MPAYVWANSLRSEYKIRLDPNVDVYYFLNLMTHVQHLHLIRKPPVSVLTVTCVKVIWQKKMSRTYVRSDWLPKFATRLNIIIRCAVVQRVYEWSSCPFAKMTLPTVLHIYWLEEVYLWSNSFPIPYSIPVRSRVQISRREKLTFHCEFLEYWNTQKSVWRIWQHFSCLLNKGIPKIWKKLDSQGGFLRAD